MWSILASLYLILLLLLLFTLGPGLPALLLYAVGSSLLFGNLFLEGGARLRGGAWVPPLLQLSGVTLFLLGALFGVEVGGASYWVVYGLLVITVAGGAAGSFLRPEWREGFSGRVEGEVERFGAVALAVAGAAYWDLSGFFPAAATIAFAFPALRKDRTASHSAWLFRLIPLALFLALLLPTNPRRGETGLLSLLSLLLLWVSEGGPKPARGVRKGVDYRGLKGLFSSFLIYYGIPFRLLRLRRFYSQFVGPGSLVFDVGAHLGNRVRAFRSFDARVIALEPQRSCSIVLNRLYGDDGMVETVPEAVGAAPGEAELRVAPDHPTMSTLSAEWISRVRENYPEQDIRWDRTETVRVTTLDNLIRRFGIPDFVKVDVEGFEPQVLRGLSEAIPALSFEFLPAAIDGALECVSRLEEIGSYEFNFSLGERMRLELPEWCGAEELRSRLLQMVPGAPSGDVYARRLRSNTR